jgi:hypothetical protein
LYDELNPINEHGKLKIVVDNKTAWLRGDGVLVREAAEHRHFFETFFSFRAHLFPYSLFADKQIIVGDKLIRTIYSDYLFKGPFGGYWFPEQTVTIVYERCNEKKCKNKFPVLPETEYETYQTSFDAGIMNILMTTINICITSPDRNRTFVC